jgi:acyl carrier protein
MHRRQLLLEYLGNQAAWLLGLGAAGPPIDEHQPLLRLGMDSLMAVEFRNLLASALQRSLSATFVFDYPTIGAQADFLTNHAAHERDAHPEGDAILEELETLSEAEAEELLKEELKRS